jgi:hypothetical protein
MRTPRLITIPLAAALVAAAVAGPAAAVPDIQTRSDAGTSANVYVPPAELGLGDAATPAADPPTWPTNPQPVTQPSVVVAAPASGFDWGSAGVGAAAALGACAIALAAILGLRRHGARPRSLTTR